MSKNMTPALSYLFPANTSCRIVIPFLQHFEKRYGSEKLKEAYATLGPDVPPLDYLKDISNFISFEFTETLIDFFTRYTQDDPHFFKNAALTTARPEATGILYHFLKSIGGPKEAYRLLPIIARGYKTTSETRVEELKNGKVIISCHSVLPERNHNRCIARMWQLAAIASLWGQRYSAHELRCQQKGAESCVYEIKWKNKYDRAVTLALGLCVGGALGFLVLSGTAGLPFSVALGTVIGGAMSHAISQSKFAKEAKAALKEFGTAQAGLFEELQKRYAEVQNFNLSLERRVKERTHELEEAKQCLSSALERANAIDHAKTVLFNNVSHEFRTPLTLILGPLTELIHSDKVEKDLELNSTLQMIRRNADRLLYLVNQLLDYALLEAGKMQLREETIRISTEVEQLTEAFRPTIEAMGIKLNFSSQIKSEVIQTDPRFWERIMFNLLSNAKKFTPEEGQIKVDLAKSTKLGSETMVLRISDTGIGIPEKDQPLIFSRFHRVSAQDGNTAPGVGLGLAFVKELVELMGGQITFESKVNRGTVFRVEVPIHRSRQNARAAANIKTPPTHVIEPSILDSNRDWVDHVKDSGKNDFILVIDDNSDILTYMLNLLQNEYDLEFALNGEKGFEKVQTRIERNARLPDLIVADIMMPGGGGIEFLKKVRSIPEISSIPVILLSAKSEEDSRIEGLENRADDYVSKPFSRSELLARIRTHLELSRMRKQVHEFRTKEEILAIASHELRTPLTSLKLSAQLMRESFAQNKPPSASVTNHLLNSISRMEDIVFKFLDVSMMRAGKMEIENKPFELISLCKDMIAEAQLSYPNREIKFEASAPSILIRGDRTKLFEAILNLLSNGLKYSGAETTLSINISSVETSKGPKILLMIKDQGIGIPEEYLPKLFQPFFRVPGNKAQMGAEEGLGLGLHIARLFIEGQSGSIEVQSKVGQGTEFRVYLIPT